MIPSPGWPEVSHFILAWMGRLDGWPGQTELHCTMYNVGYNTKIRPRDTRPNMFGLLQLFNLATNIFPRFLINAALYKSCFRSFQFYQIITKKKKEIYDNQWPNEILQLFGNGSPQSEMDWNLGSEGHYNKYIYSGLYFTPFYFKTTLIIKTRLFGPRMWLFCTPEPLF